MANQSTVPNMSVAPQMSTQNMSKPPVTTGGGNVAQPQMSTAPQVSAAPKPTTMPQAQPQPQKVTTTPQPTTQAKQTTSQATKPTDFYKENGSYYRSDTGAKVSNVAELQTLAKAGGKEVQKTTTPTQQQPQAQQQPQQAQFTPQQESGLEAAASREASGTANATDLENLKTARSKGWLPKGSTSGTNIQPQKPVDPPEILTVQQKNALSGYSEAPGGTTEGLFSSSASSDAQKTIQAILSGVTTDLTEEQSHLATLPKEVQELQSFSDTLAAEIEAKPDESGFTDPLLSAYSKTLAEREKTTEASIEASAEEQLDSQKTINEQTLGAWNTRMASLGIQGSSIEQTVLASTIKDNEKALQSIQNAKTTNLLAAKQAFEDNNFKLASQQIEEANAKRTQYIALQGQIYQFKQAYADSVQKTFEWKNTLAQQGLDNMSKSGIDPSTISDTAMASYDKDLGLAAGTTKAILTTGYKQIQAKNEADEAAVASSWSNFLANSKTGGTYTVNGVDYTVMGTDEKGKTHSFEKNSATGDIYSVTYDPTTGKATSEKIGNVGGESQIVNYKVNGVDAPFAQSTDANGKITLTPLFNSNDASSSLVNSKLTQMCPTGTTGTPYRDSSDPYYDQCGAGVNDMYDESVGKVWGSTQEEKAAALAQHGTIDPTKVKTNDTVVIDAGDTDHVAIVNSVYTDPNTGERMVKLTEQNWQKKDGKGIWTNERTLSVNDESIIGFTRIPLRAELKSGSDAGSTTGGISIGGVTIGSTTGASSAEVNTWASAIQSGSGSATISTVPKELQTAVLAKITSDAESGNQGLPAGLTQSGKIESSVEGYATKPVEGAGGYTQAIIDQNAVKYAITGSMPSIGIGSKPAAMAARTAIQNRAGQLADTAGTDLMTLQADYKANASALSQQIKLQANVSQFEETALKNLKTAESLMGGAGNTQSPILNKYIQAVKTGAAGDGNTQAFKVAIETFANEYAKIMSGSTSASGATVSSREDAMNMINSKMSPDMIVKTIAVMRQDMENRKEALKETISGISSEIGSFYSNVKLTPSEDPQAKANFAQALQDSRGMSVSQDTIDAEWERYLATL